MIRKLLLLFGVLFSVVGCQNIDNVKNLENISISIKEGTLTNSSATIIITDVSGRNNIYGEWFRIDKRENGKWKELDTIIDDYYFNLIGYVVDNNNIVEIDHDWEYIYGKLENGKYRLVKEIDGKYFAIEFVIN